MKVTKAVITAASRLQRKLPLQSLIDRDGNQKSVLEILVEEALQAGAEDIAVVVHPGDEHTYSDVTGDHSRHVTFIVQDAPRGYGHALHCAVDFTGDAPFLHLVGDHLYVNRSEKACAAHLVEVAARHNCTVSAVQAVKEHVIPLYGVIGGQRIHGSKEIYKVDKVIEKPTPTLAEQQLQVPGLRSGHYLAFFGMHVLTHAVMEILAAQIQSDPDGTNFTLTAALNALSGHEQYLALEINDWRYDVGTRYGLLKAQLSLALSGKDRDLILNELLELFTSRELGTIGR